jgi:hypothetical protein
MQARTIEREEALSAAPIHLKKSHLLRREVRPRRREATSAAAAAASGAASSLTTTFAGDETETGSCFPLSRSRSRDRPAVAARDLGLSSITIASE